jgi:hypothetical protein
MKQKFFIILSLICLLISIFLHVSAYINDYSKLSPTPYITLFVFGIFLGLGWFLTNKKSSINRKIKKIHKQLFYIIFLIIFVYLLSVFYKSGLVQNDGVVAIVDGKKVINNHGTIVKELSDSEYIILQTWSLRLQSIFCICWFFTLLGLSNYYKNYESLDIEENED